MGAHLTAASHRLWSSGRVAAPYRVVCTPKVSQDGYVSQSRRVDGTPSPRDAVAVDLQGSGVEERECSTEILAIDDAHNFLSRVQSNSMVRDSAATTCSSSPPPINGSQDLLTLVDLSARQLRDDALVIWTT